MKLNFSFNESTAISDILHGLKEQRMQLVVEKDSNLKEIEALELQATQISSNSHFALVALNQKFQDMETEIKSNSKVIKDTTQYSETIEENLGKFVAQRDKARQVYLLLDAATNPDFKVEKVKDMTIDEIVKGLEIAKIIHIFPTDIADIIRIRKTCDTMESKLLDLFQKSYESRDVSVMRRIAGMLQPLNDSKNCIQAFINQHDFFSSSLSLTVSKEELSNSFFETDIVNNISQVQFTAYLRSIRKLFKSLVKAIVEEWPTLCEVFIDYFNVLCIFIDRMFLQVVHSIIDQALRLAEHISDLHYLRTLMTIKGQLHILEQELIAVDIKFDRSQASLFQQKVKQLIQESVMHELNPQQLVSKEINACISYYQRINSKLPDQMVIEKQEMIKQMKTTGITTAEEATFPYFEKIKVLKFTIEVFERIQFLFTSKQEIANMVCKVYTGLIKALYTQELTKELTEIATHLNQQGKTLIPDYKRLLNIESIIFFLKTIEHHFNGLVAPLLQCSMIDYKEATSCKNDLVTKFEQDMQNICLEIIQCNNRWMDTVLTRQNKLEYKQNEDEIDLTKNCSDTCNEIIKVVEKTLEWIQKVFKGRNAEQLRLTLGDAVLLKLKDHVKTLTVNDMGALMLTKYFIFI